MYGVRNRDHLPESTKEEFDGLAAKLKTFLLKEHNVDGTHNFNPDVVGVTVDQIIDAYQARGQWWKWGPWILNNPDAGLEMQNTAIIRPPDPTGTYNDYRPDGIDTAIGLSLDPSGAVTITGIYNDQIAYDRFLYIRNRDAALSITLAHENTNSTAAYRFSFPEGGNVVIDGRESLWLFYDSSTQRWTSVGHNTSFGTWTPTLNGITIASGDAEYTKTGNLVSISAVAVWPVTADGGAAQIRGCPFVPAYQGYPSLAIGYNNSTLAATALMDITTGYISFWTLAGVAVTNVQFSNSILRVSGSYRLLA
jgi:hypothetical protein